MRQCHVSIADGLRQACSLVPGPARTRASQNEYEGTKQILGLIRAQGAKACLEKLCPYCSHSVALRGRGRVPVFVNTNLAEGDAIDFGKLRGTAFMIDEAGHSLS